MQDFGHDSPAYSQAKGLKKGLILGTEENLSQMRNDLSHRNSTCVQVKPDKVICRERG